MQWLGTTLAQLAECVLVHTPPGFCSQKGSVREKGDHEIRTGRKVQGHSLTDEKLETWRKEAEMPRSKACVPGSRGLSRISSARGCWEKWNPSGFFIEGLCLLCWYRAFYTFHMLPFYSLLSLASTFLICHLHRGRHSCCLMSNLNSHPCKTFLSLWSH